MLVTRPFVPMARAAASSLGLADLRLLQFPHPLGGTEPDVVRSWADAAVEAVLAEILR